MLSYFDSLAQRDAEKRRKHWAKYHDDDEAPRLAQGAPGGRTEQLSLVGQAQQQQAGGDAGVSAYMCTLVRCLCLYVCMYVCTFIYMHILYLRIVQCVCVRCRCLCVVCTYVHMYEYVISLHGAVCVMSDTAHVCVQDTRHLCVSVCAIRAKTCVQGSQRQK